MSGKPPDYQFPSNLQDVFKGWEETIFGPEYSRIINDMDRRERSLVRAVQAPDERFSLDGTVITGRSPSAEARYGGRIKELVGRLATAGSSDTDIDVVVNGNVVGTIVIPAGQKRGELFVNYPIASRTDEFWVDVTAAGAGAMQLVVYVRIIPTK